MSAPPVPPRPSEAIQNSGRGVKAPPPLPPLPPSFKVQNEIYITPSIYEVESPPRFENPMIAPRPHRIDPSIPANMAKTLDDQLYQSPSSVNYNPGFVMPTAPPPPQNTWSPWNVQQSFANLSVNNNPPPMPLLPLPQPPPLPAVAIQQSPVQAPSLTAPLPLLSQLQTAAPIVQQPIHDPLLKVSWCRDVLFLVDRSQGQGTPSTDPPVGPVTIADPALARLAQIAVSLVLQIAASFTPQPGQKMPLHVAEAVAMRATLSGTGAFPEFIRHNPRTAFRDFETAARGGFATAWFRLGRDYENFNDHQHARECFERGVKLNIESCLYRMGMAHLLGQLSLPSNPTTALPLLHRAATLASITCPQPAYVYALLLLSEFTQIAVPPALFASSIPQGSSPHLEARKHLERAAFLHFPAAQYKLGHAYEFAEPPFPFDPLLSVQYYSLASQQGEVEADMALSKWFLCGSGGAAVAGKPDARVGGFEKDESLALVFAQKAASRGLPSAEFAMGYYSEVGVGQPKNLEAAGKWYLLAQEHGNADATERLRALSQPAAKPLSREEHEDITEAKLVRRRTMAMQRMETAPLSPPWEGTTFPTMREQQEQAMAMTGVAQTLGGRRREDGRKVLENIRKNSIAGGLASVPSTTTNGGTKTAVPSRQRYEWGDNIPASAPLPATTNSSPTSGRASPVPSRTPYRTDSPSGRKTPPPPVGGRPPSPGRRVASGGRPQSPGRLGRMRLNLEDTAAPLPSASLPSSVPTIATVPASASESNANAASATTPRPQGNNTLKPTKRPQTFAEMGIHGAKAEEKDCVVM